MKSLKWLFTTKLGWLIISFIWTALSIVVDNNVDSYLGVYMMIPSLGYILVITLVAIAYAWVINPMKERVETRRKNEASKKV